MLFYGREIELIVFLPAGNTKNNLNNLYQIFLWFVCLGGWMEKAIAERFLNKSVVMIIIDDGRPFPRSGIVVLVTDESLVLQYHDGRENAFDLSRIQEIKESGGERR